MELIGRRLSSDEWRAVLNDPEAVGALLYGDLDDDDAEMPDPELDLGKSWHALHYLLTGSAWGFGDGVVGAVILGGVEIGEDGGYGPARLFGPEAVRAVATELDALDVESLRTRYDADAMANAEIYPGGCTNDGAEFDDLVVHLVELRQFYRTAADNDQAVLLAVT
ncbi:YfbM family protein [Plantactinospora endophytica]|nr:YfbM family protein [Plantactinospora endophytica]